jgi:hypothetical protein
MTGHRRDSPFIRYELPVMIAGKPTKPPDDQGGKGKPRPMTTLALGEEGGGSSSGVVTTMAIGEEGGSDAS